jgi:preprotein translocase subunit SecG
MTGILVIVFFIFSFYLSSRISKLEDEVKRLKSAGQLRPTTQTTDNNSADSNSYQSSQTVPPSMVMPANGMYSPQAYQAMEPTAIDQFFAWLKKDFMMKLGAFLLLLAIGWFVSYAFAENWIGPMGRIALGLLLGALMLALGAWRIQSFKHQGGIFAVLGSTTIILTLYAAREIYDFFTPATALALMFFSVVFVAFLAVRYKSEPLAFAALVLGSSAPLLTNAPSPDALGLFTYLLIIAVGTLWVVWNTGWTKLTPVSLGLTFLYSLPFLFDSLQSREVVVLFTFVFVSLYYGANIVSLIRRHGEGKTHMATHTLTALGTAIFLVVWIESAIGSEWKSLLYTFWALAFAGGTYVVFNFTANSSAFYLYGATSIGLIGVATAAELSGPALTIAYILETALLAVAAAQIVGWSLPLKRILLVAVIPLLFSLDSLFSYNWQDSILHADLVVVLLIISTFGLIGLVLSQLSSVSEEDRQELNGYMTAFLGVSGFYAVALVWLITHAVLMYDFATTVSLIIYTIAGVGLVVSAGGNKALGIAGGVLIGGVVFRLLLVEVWEMSLEGRIATFLIIGALLISTAFIRKSLTGQSKTTST